MKFPIIAMAALMCPTTQAAALPGCLHSIYDFSMWEAPTDEEIHCLVESPEAIAPLNRLCSPDRESASQDFSKFLELLFRQLDAMEEKNSATDAEKPLALQKFQEVNEELRRFKINSGITTELRTLSQVRIACSKK